MLLKQSRGFRPVNSPNFSDAASHDSLRKRIQRIETFLHGRQPLTEPQQSISSALAGIEKLLGILAPDVEQQSTLLMPSSADTAPSPSSTGLTSPIGSQAPQARSGKPLAFLAQSNHKRWG